MHFRQDLVFWCSCLPIWLCHNAMCLAQSTSLSILLRHSIARFNTSRVLIWPPHATFQGQIIAVAGARKVDTCLVVVVFVLVQVSGYFMSWAVCERNQIPSTPVYSSRQPAHGINHQRTIVKALRLLNMYRTTLASTSRLDQHGILVLKSYTLQTASTHSGDML